VHNLEVNKAQRCTRCTKKRDSFFFWE